jgi:hypothetical protein
LTRPSQFYRNVESGLNLFSSFLDYILEYSCILELISVFF